MRRSIILLTVLLSACSVSTPEPSCTVVDYTERTDKAWSNFNDLELAALKIFYSVKISDDDRIKLPPIMDQIQEARDVYAQLQLPSCYESARSSYLEYMDLTIVSLLYLYEGGEQSDSEYTDKLNASTDALNRAINEYKKLGE